MADSAERNELGRTAPATAIGSGIPAGHRTYVEGITIRLNPPEGRDGQPQGAISQPIATPPATSATPPATQPGVIGTATVTAQTLNVRAAPSQTAAIVRTLQKGTDVQVFQTVNENGTWLRISAASSEWVAGWLTSWTDAMPPASTLPAPPTTPGKSEVVPGVVVLEGSPPTWQDCESSSKCWADPANPIMGSFACQQDGEYFLSGNSGPVASPIPPGTWWITGITARACPPTSE